MNPGRTVNQNLVRKLLHEMGYSLQSMRKTREGTQHPDRDAQFAYINTTAADYQKRNQPVISVDTKKKEPVGYVKNAGREWQPAGQPETARVHDSCIPELGKINPYGVYDPTRNEGRVNVGSTDHDTATFAVARIRAGGGVWVARLIPVPASFSSLLTAVAATTHDPGCGSWSYRTSPTRPG